MLRSRNAKILSKTRTVCFVVAAKCLCKKTDLVNKFHLLALLCNTKKEFHVKVAS